MFAKGMMRAALALMLAAVPAFCGATITIVNVDGPNEGFNDPTPAVPVGGNTGTTVGQQRLIAFQYAASLWGAKLDSPVEIRIQAAFNPLSCNAASGVLGSAGAIQVFGNSPGVEYVNTWYHVALANKLAGVDLAPGAPGTNADDLIALFNSSLGQPNCLANSGWYYGLDTNQPVNRINLVAVLLHEFGHGLGFANFVNEATGTNLVGLPDVYSVNTLDNVTGKTWDVMTDAERAASAINPRRVVWKGVNVTKAVPEVLVDGTPLLRITAPSAIEGVYAVGAASFGPALSPAGVSGMVVQALDPADGSGTSVFDACSPLTNAAAVAGKIALVDRGTCGFTNKVKNAQDAGAVAVIVADNVAGGPPTGLGGADPAITIPSVRITLADGAAIKAQLNAGVSAILGIDLSVRAGADASGRAMLFSPNPVQPGSSGSHWDTSASPNQLMEPSINADLMHSLDKPQDLTLSLMRDIGWFSDGDGVPDSRDECLGSDTGATVAIQGCQTGVTNVTFTNGCRISDLYKACSASAKNHGEYASCVAMVSDALRKQQFIRNNQLGAIQNCAAKAKLP